MLNISLGSDLLTTQWLSTVRLLGSLKGVGWTYRIAVRSYSRACIETLLALVLPAAEAGGKYFPSQPRHCMAMTAAQRKRNAFEEPLASQKAQAQQMNNPRFTEFQWQFSFSYFSARWLLPIASHCEMPFEI